MPAKPVKNTSSTKREKSYFHVYNKGSEKRVIFKDEKDYEVFLGYLKGYLSPQVDSESVKKTFTVKGRAYKGVPHQPKNHFKKVELLAYCLMPNHFHLLVSPRSDRALERFMRSLLTRYSIYFNKKYQRSGSVFAGRYKTVEVDDRFDLCLLSRYFHQVNGCSSYSDYLGEKDTDWVKTKVVRSLVNDRTGSSYKDFVEKYKLSQTEIESLEKIVFESEAEHLDTGVAVSSSAEITRGDEEDLDQGLGFQLKFLEFATAMAVLVVLVTLGVRNIHVSQAKVASAEPVSSPAVLPATTEAEEAKPEEGQSQMVVIKIDDEAEAVNIRQQPTTGSEIIGKAKDGESFELVSQNSGWYEIKFGEVTGFVSARYADIEGASVVQAEAEVLEEIKTQMVVIETDDGSMVNVRQQPTTDSEIIGKAKDGESFELVSQNSGWYEIRLNDNSTGFIASEYAQVEGEN